MSLLKVNNPRSLLIKAENADSPKKIVTIRNNKNENKKIIIVKPEPPTPPEQKRSKILSKKFTEEITSIKVEPSPDIDDDLKMPSEIFDCNFVEEKNEVNEIPGEFYFETDHEALRGNPDYHKLLRTYALLQAKKIQAVQDVEKLLGAREIALKYPLKFLQKFNDQISSLPVHQDIPNVPIVDWDKYKIPSVSHVVQKPETRYKGAPPKKQEIEKEKVEGLLDCKVERNAKGQFLVRGRVFDASKPQTFNQPWTPEEQRRLEELLEEYPSEEIEMERWKKIATCLGNRTSIQVQSRVQKYFQKLQKAGLPIPGRYKRNAPASHSLARPKKPSMRGKYSNSLIGSRNSTFFPDMKPTVKMTDEDEREADESVLSAETSSSSGLGKEEKPAKYRLIDTAKYYIVEEDVSDDEDIDSKHYLTPSYQRLKWLKRIRREKELELREGSSSSTLFVHTGYKCDGCGQEPIKGGRFTCLECDKDQSQISGGIDFCLECAPKGLVSDEKPSHTSNHNLRPVRKKMTELPTATADLDYLFQNNYLDSNFVN